MTDGIISRALQAHAEREASSMAALNEATRRDHDLNMAHLITFVNRLLENGDLSYEEYPTVWIRVGGHSRLAVAVEGAFIFQIREVNGGAVSYEYHVAGFNSKLGDYIHILEDRGIASLADLGTAYTILNERGLLPK